MKKRRVIGAAAYGAIAATSVLGWSPASGHHSNAIFDLDRIVLLEGTVTRYDWRNPHVYIYLDVRDLDDAVAGWEIEADPTALMVRSGWTRTTLTRGDRVLARVSPDRNAARNHALLRTLTTPDGQVLTPRSSGRESTVGAASLEGTWDAIRGFAAFVAPDGPLTAKGAAAVADYRPQFAQVAQCIPYPLPIILFAPYLNEIEILDDRILIRSEFFDVVRTIHMDGRDHLENGERTNQGHSIGRWEGRTLVVDTRLFADDRSGNRNGIPSGAQKHVVERYTLTEDGTRIDIEYVIEDPEYLASPRRGETFWDYAPDAEFVRVECDPENARLFAID